MKSVAKKLWRLTGCAIISLLALSASFGQAGEPAKRHQAGHTGKKRLLLFAKNPASWTIVKGGASGSMVYCGATGEFTLNAAGLTPRSPYALVRYADAPPLVEVLSRGVSDGRGRLDLHGSWGNWTKKFWLVSGDDVEVKAGAGKLVNWRPHRYLFEEKPLGVACVCPEPEVP